MTISKPVLALVVGSASIVAGVYLPARMSIGLLVACGIALSVLLAWRAEKTNRGEAE